ncbi:MAG: type II and III secretion system family protein [Alphaproteobacteria bacterium]|nr:type II and III secretion system family protein [Alphaproteobacteria bacterium]
MLLAMGPVLAALVSCADAGAPKVRAVDIPPPATAERRPSAVNERPDSVMYLPLGQDVLVPITMSDDPLPSDVIGPFELRSETLAGALQLILADYDIPLAFETEEGLTRRITVANLKGPLNRVVRRICGLADLYCAFEDGLLVIKETQTFTVSIPPVGGESGFISALGQGLQAITGESPIVDEGTRTIVYTATHRTAELAERYFQRMRKSTALIVFEIYIWEVALNSGNLTGIDWSQIDTFGKFNLGLNLAGGVTGSEITPISIGLPTTQTVDFANNVLDFISTYGAVKTISQPQITMLSGSEASLRVADTENYVSSLERTVDDGEETVSTQTDTVDTGFTLTIESAWDNATVYGNIEIELQEFQGFQPFEAGDTELKLPRTTERELVTQVRIRPGDSLLIAGLIRENDELNESGPGFMNVIFPTSRSATVSNSELVFLLRPRVIAYTDAVQGGGSLLEPDQFDYSPPVDMNPDLTYGVVKPDYRIMEDGPVIPERRQPQRLPVSQSGWERDEADDFEGMGEGGSPMTSVPLDILNPGGQ